MLRVLILLIFASGVAVLVLPFLVSSLYVDQRGIAITGRVQSKHESVTTKHSGWERTCEVSIEYDPPDDASVSYLGVRLDPEEYDGFHIGQTVPLHYLRRQDIPDLPLAKFLRELHALPTARLAGRRTFSALETYLRKNVVVCSAIAGIGVLLFLWHRSGLRGFTWAVGVCVVLGLTAFWISGFPTPTSRPAVALRSGSGRVKSVDRIDRLFTGSRTRGVEAGQPVDVVGVEFVPEGRTEPVVAVDLIDRGSIAGLKEGAMVGIEYESKSPRTAYIQNANRTFVARNLEGIVLEGVLSVLVLAALFGGVHYLGKAWNRLLRSR